MGLPSSGGRLPRGFTRRVRVLAPGAEIPVERAAWHDALVLVEEGAVEIECALGAHRTFAAGAVLVFAGLDLLVVRNRGVVDAVIVGISRRADASRGPAPSSPP